jgi:hypothetical protein
MMVDEKKAHIAEVNGQKVYCVRQTAKVSLSRIQVNMDIGSYLTAEL